jgi:hypothetical protein
VLKEVEEARWEIARPRARDNRRTARFREDTLVVIDVNGHDVIAAIRDISTGGAILEVEEALSVGEYYNLRFPGMAAVLQGRVLSFDQSCARLVFTTMSTSMELELTKHLERGIRY